MSKIFVGTLPNDITEDELRDMFTKYSEIRLLSLKNPPRPPPYAFIEFADEQAAGDAVHDLNGTELRGCRIRVEICRPQTRERTISTYENHRFGSNYRALVSNLDHRISWQDLKDIFNDVVDVVHTEVDGKGRGVVSFRSVRDLDYAIRKLDDREYYGRRIRVYEERPARERYDRRYQRSESRGRRGKSMSRSRSASQERGGGYRRRTDSGRYDYGRDRDRSPEHSHDQEHHHRSRRDRSHEQYGERDRSEEREGHRHRHHHHRHRSTSSREEERERNERDGGRKRSMSRNESAREERPRHDDNQREDGSPRSSRDSRDSREGRRIRSSRSVSHEHSCGYGLKTKQMDGEPPSRSPSPASRSVTPERT